MFTKVNGMSSLKIFKNFTILLDTYKNQNYLGFKR